MVLAMRDAHVMDMVWNIYGFFSWKLRDELTCDMNCTNTLDNISNLLIWKIQEHVPDEF